MRRYIFIVLFAILILAGICVAVYLLLNREKEWSSYMLAITPILTGLTALIWNVTKKELTEPNSDKVISGKEIHYHYYHTPAASVPFETTNTTSQKSPSELPFNNLTEIERRNPHFTGRQDVFEKIIQTFEKKEAIALTQAISGLGGIGKTQVALEYAYRYGYEYDCIWWVKAEKEETIFASFQNFALKKKIINEDTKEAEIIIEAVRDWMHENDNWLFIFDNAEDEKSLQPYLPIQSFGRRHVLITSRNTQFLKCSRINIGIFTEAEACSFIEKYSKTPADKHFKELAKKMGYLPLALDQAGAYMSIHQKSYEVYLQLYNKKNLALLSKYMDDSEKKTVATSWQISFEKIENPAAKQLLNLCAFFAPDNIFLQWFKDASEVFSEELHELREAVADEMEFDDTIAELTKYSLVTLDEGSISIHRLVQEVIRDNLKSELTKWCNYCISILNELKFFEFHTAELRARFSQLVPHILSVTDEIIENEATGNLFYFLGWGFNELANYKLALEYYHNALSIREKVLGKEHPDTATTYNNIGEVYRRQGDYAKALEYCHKALSIDEKVSGKEHPNIATTYNNMAMVYYNQGDYSKALEYYQKALSIREKIFGKEHPNTATTYNNMATVYDNQGDYGKALEYYQKALSISENVLGIEHPSTAATYNNMAMVYDNQGDYDKALEYCHKALSINEKILGKEHPDTANTYNNMAMVYYSQGDYVKALEYYQKALSINEKILGNEHPDTANTYNNMAMVYYRQGDYIRALEYYRKALTIREKVLGKEHPDTAATYNNIAAVYDNQGDYGKALERYLMSYIVFFNVLGLEHPNTKTVLNKMANAYEKNGKLEPFEDWLNKRIII